MTKEEMERRVQESDELYKKDIVYKTLVDNYVKASVKYSKNNSKENSNKLSESLNALAKYKDKLHNEYVLNFVKFINLTNEDIRDLIVNGIINTDTLIKILKFKKIIDDE